METIQGVTETCAYSYDLAGRLAEVRRNGSLVGQYGYDAHGNRLSQASPAGSIVGSYDAQDRPIQYGATTYAHTANGELQNKTTGSGTTTYAYDVLE